MVSGFTSRRKLGIIHCGIRVTLMYYVRILFQAILFVGVFLACGPAGAATENKRIALVVGIDKYSGLPETKQLKKAVNDARAVATALKGAPLSFDVTKLENPTRTEMSQAFGSIEQSISPGDTVFVFFAGHGIDIAGSNYLLPGDVPSPVDAQGRRLPTRAFRDAAFNAAEVLSSFQQRGAGTVIAIFDACREPFDDEGKRSLGLTRGGLAEMRGSPQGTFIVFSAGAKQLALDRLSPNDPNPNSVFTRSLIPLLKVPGQSLQRMAKELQPVVRDLAQTVDHVQTPAYYDEISGDYYLVPASTGSTPQRALIVEQPKPPAIDPCVGALDHWKSTEAIGNRQAFEAHISRFRDCPYADLARVRIATLTVPVIPTPPPPPPVPQIQPTRGDDNPSVCRGPGSLWDVDGSSVILKADPNLPGRKFYFCQPGGSARSEGARAGNLFFSGQRSGNRYSGTAYVNSGRCGSFSYSVSGSVTDGDRGVSLSGQRPIIDESSCKVSSYRSTNFTLTYKQRI